ncbi:hypothetical protein CLOSCI_02179 [[Clostridium] scindens ATCC 35704]|nr:hypothetical protein CLOSCI_02179 [[Clostridium] scindens ATCC 35704]
MLFLQNLKDSRKELFNRHRRRLSGNPNESFGCSSCRILPVIYNIPSFCNERRKSQLNRKF